MNRQWETCDLYRNKKVKTFCEKKKQHFFGGLTQYNTIHHALMSVQAHRVDDFFSPLNRHIIIMVNVFFGVSNYINAKYMHFPPYWHGILPIFTKSEASSLTALFMFACGSRLKTHHLKNVWTKFFKMLNLIAKCDLFLWMKKINWRLFVILIETIFSAKFGEMWKMRSFLVCWRKYLFSSYFVHRQQQFKNSTTKLADYSLTWFASRWI